MFPICKYLLLLLAIIKESYFLEKLVIGISNNCEPGGINISTIF
jgi:hypothetical protein